MNSLTAYALARELDGALGGAVISRAEIFSGGATWHVQGAPFPFLHLLHFGRSREFFPGRDRIASPDNAHEAMKSLRGARIVRVRSLGIERILLFELSGSSAWGDDLLLRIDLAPSGKPAALFGGKGKRATEFIGSGAARFTSSAEDAPPAKGLSILALPDDPPAGLLESAAGAVQAELSEKTRALTKTKGILGWLLASVGGIDPVMAREVTRSCGGDPERTWAAVREIGRSALSERWSWRLYEFPRSDRAVLYPIALPVDTPPQTFTGYIEAFQSAAERSFIPSLLAALKREAAMRASRELKKLRKLSANIAGDIEQAERSHELRHLGNLLAAHRHAMKQGTREITVRDFSGDRNVTIPLDPARPPDDNIRAYFKRAKKGEKGIMILRTRRREVERILSERERALAAIESAGDPDHLLALLPVRSAPAKSAEPQRATRFRRFDLDGRHVVLVGRSNHENDLLTHRFASPGDLWFHAAGVPGSHVILKGATRSTPKSVIERVAAIAAYFSKARHSTTVPVVYTEKRYVRKPRKSKAGTAICQRSTTLFVRPALPGAEKD